MQVTLPIRHLEKSLAFFTARDFPVDFIRTSLQLACLHEGVTPPSLERALAHIVSTHTAFQLLEASPRSHDGVWNALRFRGSVGASLQNVGNPMDRPSIPLWPNTPWPVSTLPQMDHV